MRIRRCFKEDDEAILTRSRELLRRSKEILRENSRPDSFMGRRGQEPVSEEPSNPGIDGSGSMSPVKACSHSDN